MYRGLKAKDGTKLYAVCGWEENQHKIYNAYDRALIARYEAYDTGKGIDEAEEWVAKVEKAMQWINFTMPDGLVYAPWDMRNFIKELIVTYDIRH